MAGGQLQKISTWCGGAECEHGGHGGEREDVPGPTGKTRVDHQGLGVRVLDDVRLCCCGQSLVELGDAASQQVGRVANGQRLGQISAEERDHVPSGKALPLQSPGRPVHQIAESTRCQPALPVYERLPPALAPQHIKDVLDMTTEGTVHGQHRRTRRRSRRCLCGSHPVLLRSSSRHLSHAVPNGRRRAPVTDTAGFSPARVTFRAPWRDSRPGVRRARRGALRWLGSV